MRLRALLEAIKDEEPKPVEAAVSAPDLEEVDAEWDAIAASVPPGPMDGYALEDESSDSELEDDDDADEGEAPIQGRAKLTRKEKAKARAAAAKERRKAKSLAAAEKQKTKQKKVSSDRNVVAAAAPTAQKKPISKAQTRAEIEEAASESTPAPAAPMIAKSTWRQLGILVLAVLAIVAAGYAWMNGHHG
jgi:hypothetical protein